SRISTRAATPSFSSSASSVSLASSSISEASPPPPTPGSSISFRSSAMARSFIRVRRSGFLPLALSLAIVNGRRLRRLDSHGLPQRELLPDGEDVVREDVESETRGEVQHDQREEDRHEVEQHLLLRGIDLHRLHPLGEEHG